MSTPKRNLEYKCDGVVVYTLRRTERDTEILLLKRNKGNLLDQYWSHIYGGIEQGEKAWETGLRELQEEAQLTALHFYSASCMEEFYSAHDDTITHLPVFVAFVAADAEVVINEEHSDFRWFSIEEAFKVAPFANQQEVLRLVNNNFILRALSEFLRIK